MRILLVYNDYKIRGGETAAFESERDLLRAHGHDVATYTRSNEDVDRQHPLALGLRTVWSRADFAEARRRIRAHRSELVHVHNFFPQISPSIYYAAAAEKAPVVQTLHNYRLFCPAGTFFRDGHVCEDCLGRPVPWPGVWHACYRDDRLASFAVASMLAAHRALSTFRRYVARYIALTEFTRAKYIEGGLPAARIVIKPNFLRDDPGFDHRPGGYALFAGRMSHEKGVETLVEAWRRNDGLPPLKIAGDGPLLASVKEKAADSERVDVLGPRPRSELFELMRGASVLLFPSIWYECLPYTLLEAFAIGLPVIVSEIGSVESVVRDGVTGFHAAPGDPDAWADTVRRAVADPERLRRISRAARDEYERVYAPDANYERMMLIYRAARSRLCPAPARRPGSAQR